MVTMILNLESSQFSFTLEPSESPAEMGREEPCKIVVESSSVSRKHCELTCEDGKWFVKDLGSRYGTTVNNKSAAKPTALGNGDVLKLGTQNFIVSLMASNDMEDLGRHLSGGKVRGLVNAAMQKNPTAPKTSARKKRAEPAPETMMYEKDELANAINKAAADKADASENSEEKSEEADDNAENAGEEGDVKVAPAGMKASKKTSIRSRTLIKKKSSPVAMIIKIVVLVAVAGAAGYFGWKQYQQSQQAAAPGAPTSGDAAPAAKLPPKPDAVSLPAKPATEEKKPDAATPPETKPEDKPAPKADEKPSDAKADEKAEPKKDEKTEEKPAPKADEK